MNFDTDFKALGLRDPSPFAILERPRAKPNSKTPPKKSGPKPNKSLAQQAAMALETPEERRARQLQMNSAPKFNVPIATQQDSMRTAAIKGKL